MKVNAIVGSSVERILLENAKIFTRTPCGGLKRSIGFIVLEINMFRDSKRMKCHFGHR